MLNPRRMTTHVHLLLSMERQIFPNPLQRLLRPKVDLQKHPMKKSILILRRSKPSRLGVQRMGVQTLLLMADRIPTAMLGSMTRKAATITRTRPILLRDIGTK